MAFVLSNWNCISRATTAPKPVFYTYVSEDDALATISTSAYFNDVAFIVDTNDLIYIVGSDGSAFYRVTSANGVQPVTITAFDSVPAGSIGTADLAANSVTLAKLASGITPSHVVKYAAQYTTVAGATQTITVPGVQATDLVFAQVKTPGGTPRTIVSAAATLNTVTIVMSGDPTTDHVLYYQVLRAVS
jgi:hypothetical protein